MTTPESFEHNVGDDCSESENSCGSEIFRRQAELSKLTSNKDVDDAGKSNTDSVGKKKTGNGEGGVRFGSVRVHTHKMTLGDNPGAKTAGPPVTLEWDVQESERFEDVNGFAMKYHNCRDSQRVIEEHAHRIPAKERTKIAGEGHSAGSIRKLQMEVYNIKEDRKKSAEEDPGKAIEQQQKKGRGGIFGIFDGLFKQGQHMFDDFDKY